MCAGPRTRSDTAFMGFYAVDPRFQRLGIGKALWSKTMERLANLNVGLYGVPSMSAKYKKSGFMVEDSARMLVFESQTYAEDKLNLEGLKRVDELAGCRLIKIDGSNVDEETFKKLVNYDESVQQFNREELLRIYLTGQNSPLTVAIVRDIGYKQCEDADAAGECASQRKSSSCCVVSPGISAEQPTEIRADKAAAESSGAKFTPSRVSLNSLSELERSEPVDLVDSTTTLTSTIGHELRQDEEILGYGIIRTDNNNGGIIGPIYADTDEACEVLLRYLMSNFNLNRGHIFSAMALTTNKQACQILEKVGLREMEQCSRMFTKFVPEADFSKVYYVHSPNFTLF